MNSNKYDVIVIGAGLMGTSMAAALVAEGKSVLLLEERVLYNNEGASHGDSRVMRVNMNFEGEILTETARASLFAMLNMETGWEKISRNTPALFLVEQNSGTHDDIMTKVRRAKQEIFEVENRVLLDNYRFVISENHIGLLDKEAAVFNPAKLLERLYRYISTQNIRSNERVSAWHSGKNGVRVRTQKNDDEYEYTAQELVITAGAWTPQVLGAGNVDREVLAALTQGMRIEEIPLFYFEYPLIGRDNHLKDDNLIFGVMDPDPAKDFIMYAMPDIDETGRKRLKVGFHHGGITDEPKRREITKQEIEKAEGYMHALFGQPLKVIHTDICHYSIASDKHLPIVGRIPKMKNVQAAYALGGIGAKHTIGFAVGLVQKMVADEEEAFHEPGAQKKRKPISARTLSHGLLAPSKLPKIDLSELSPSRLYKEPEGPAPISAEEPAL